MKSGDRLEYDAVLRGARAIEGAVDFIDVDVRVAPAELRLLQARVEAALQQIRLACRRWYNEAHMMEESQRGVVKQRVREVTREAIAYIQKSRQIDERMRREIEQLHRWATE